jgi:C4-dicarboxylate-specific signal transduction histidine kinase
VHASPDPSPLRPDDDAVALEEEVEQLRLRVRQAEERRRALIHIMGDLNESNRRLGEQRKAMIHIMGDLRETTQEMERREHELRDKQEQLVQAGKLATLGELTTGVAHELNNPLNNIGLYIGNVIDRVHLGKFENEQVLNDLEKAMEQVQKATEIISHLRTFGRAATAITVQRVDVDDVIERALSLMNEQLRLRAIEVELDLSPEELVVLGNPIQLEQVFINLLTNARDALSETPERKIRISSRLDGEEIQITLSDSGDGIPEQIQSRIFDPFFTTKEVGAGTGLGLSITYSIVKEHGGEIALAASPRGALFEIILPLAKEAPQQEPEPLL